VGASYGQGVVTCRTVTAGAHLFYPNAGGSFGSRWRTGDGPDSGCGEQRGMQDLLKNKFKIGGDASAAAGSGGTQRRGFDRWKMGAELLAYSRPKGSLPGLTWAGLA